MDQPASLTDREQHGPVGGGTDDHGLAALLSDGLEPLFRPPPRQFVESAWFGHVPFAAWLVGAMRPSLLVELGTHNGVSYLAFCEAMARAGDGGRAYAIDTWEGDAHAGAYGEEVYDALRRAHDPIYGHFSRLLRCRFDEALDQFADGSIDLLHVDGMHTYAAVRADWDSWRPKLSSRAVTLFHDTNERERDFGVWRLWAELRDAHPSFEFLHEHGLGVLAFGPDAASGVRALCALRGDAVGRCRARFALLGDRWIAANEGDANLGLRRDAEAALAGARLQIAQRDDAAAARARAVEAAEARARADRAALTADRDGLRVDRDAQRAALRDARRHAHSLAANLGVAAAEQERLARALAHAIDARDAAQAAHAATDGELRHLTASPAWRAAGPIRAVATRYPAAVAGPARAVRLGALLATGRLGDRLALRRRVRDDAALIGGSPLFDRALYLARYPEVAASGADPLWHYIWTGAANGFDPHPLFDSRFYHERHPALADENPLAHFLRTGAAAGLDPHPLFDTAHYRASARRAGREAEPNALLDYLAVGAGAGLSPHPWFDGEGYWTDYMRGAPGDGRDPLSDYVLHGDRAGRDPHPLFDTGWYRARHPEIGDGNALVHYLRVGRDAGAAPSLLLEQGVDPEPGILRFAPEADPDVSIVIPVYGRLFETLRCLHAVARHTDGDVRFEVIVADDRPDQPIAPLLRRIAGLRVEQNGRNLGFLRSCNQAAKLARGRALVLLNNDTSVHPGWLAPMLRLLDADERTALVGAMLLNRDGTVQEAGGVMHDDGWGAPFGAGADPSRSDLNHVREVDVAIGACLLVRRAAWEEVGGFDERYAPAYFEEFDLAFALRDRGWRVLYQPLARVTHSDASSYGRAERDRQSTRNHALFRARWAAALEEQPPLGAPDLVARSRSRDRPRVLFLDDRVPEPDRHAGSVSTLHWLRLLRERDAQITYVPHDRDAPEPYTTRLRQMGVEVLTGAVDLPGWIEANGALLDHVWSARPAVTEPLLAVLAAHAPGKLIYFTHDLHHLREERRHAIEGGDELLEESRRLRRAERDIFRAARLVLTPSSDELPSIAVLAPAADAMAVPLWSMPPSPAPAAYGSSPASFAARHDVLFVGGYAHLPNVDAAIRLARDIFPRIRRAIPSARLVLAGSKPPPAVLSLAGDAVLVPGWVADLDPFYAMARLTLNPIRFGAGVKGKILGSLAAAVPVVTTTVGNEGIGLADGVDALIADDDERLALAAIRLLSDAAFCAELAANGRALLAARFSERSARAALDCVLGVETCTVCGGANAPGAPVCARCGADATDRLVGGAVLGPWRAGGVDSLDAARVPLARRAVETAGLSPPLARALDAVAAAAPLAPAGRLVVLDVSADPSPVERVLLHATGGARVVVAAGTGADALDASLRARGVEALREDTVLSFVAVGAAPTATVEADAATGSAPDGASTG